MSRLTVEEAEEIMILISGGLKTVRAYWYKMSLDEKTATEQELNRLHKELRRAWHDPETCEYCAPHGRLTHIPQPPIKDKK